MTWGKGIYQIKVKSEAQVISVHRDIIKNVLTHIVMLILYLELYDEIVREIK